MFGFEPECEHRWLRVSCNDSRSAPCWLIFDFVTAKEPGTNATSRLLQRNESFGIFLSTSAATCWRKPSSMVTISLMKSKHSFANVLVMLVFGCAIFISTVAQGGSPSGYLRSNHHFPPGRLIIDRTPNFGWNLGFNLQIDGRPVASVVQGRRYATWLPAGPHLLTVTKVPATGYTAPTSTTVNIQPSTEHLYVAMWDSGLVYLQPNGVWLTPGAYWQNHGNGAP